jgi:hypothetical protein
MYAIVTMLSTRPERAAENLRLLKEKVIPAAGKLPGYLGGLWLMDTERKRFIALTLYETEDAMRNSEQPAERIRARTVEDMGATIISVDTYEVVAEAGRPSTTPLSGQ